MNCEPNYNDLRTLVLDIDGVLTDGRVGYNGTGDEIKFFHVRDGHGIKLLQRAGWSVGAISGRRAEANRRRAEELGFDFLYEGEKNKLEAFERLLADRTITAKECVCIGDDVVDIPLLRRAGFAATVADAPGYMDEVVHFRTRLPGGHGAVRELIDFLLQKQGRWDKIMERYSV